MRIKTFEGKLKVVELAYNEFAKENDVKFAQSHYGVFGEGAKQSVLCVVAFYEGQEKGGADLVCYKCGGGVSKKVHDFSVRSFGRPLCFDCQKKQKGDA